MKNNFTLPKAFAEKWIAALRSGEYKQGQEALMIEGPYNDKKYCCLGVACDVVGINILSSYENAFPCTLSNTDALPKLLVQNHSFKAGLSEKAQTTFVSKVAALNDDGKTFPEIADWIEANVQFI